MLSVLCYTLCDKKIITKMNQPKKLMSIDFTIDFTIDANAYQFFFSAFSFKKNFLIFTAKISGVSFKREKVLPSAFKIYFRKKIATIMFFAQSTSFFIICIGFLTFMVQNANGQNCSTNDSSYHTLDDCLRNHI